MSSRAELREAVRRLREAAKARAVGRLGTGAGTRADQEALRRIARDTLREMPRRAGRARASQPTRGWHSVTARRSGAAAGAPRGAARPATGRRAAPSRQGNGVPARAVGGGAAPARRGRGRVAGRPPAARGRRLRRLSGECPGGAGDHAGAALCRRLDERARDRRGRSGRPGAHAVGRAARGRAERDIPGGSRAAGGRASTRAAACGSRGPFPFACRGHACRSLASRSGTTPAPARVAGAAAFVQVAGMPPPPTALATQDDAAPTGGAPPAAETGGPAPLAPPPPPAAKPAAGPAGAARVASAAPAPGRFAIQVASLRDPAGAAAAWRRLVRLHPSLAGLEPRPARVAEVPGEGRFYRVLGGAFATRAEAQAACARLLAEGSYCRRVPL